MLKRHCEGTFFYETNFGWQNACHISQEFGEIRFTLNLYGDTSAGRWFTKIREKLAKFH